MQSTLLGAAFGLLILAMPIYVLGMQAAQGKFLSKYSIPPGALYITALICALASLDVPAGYTHLLTVGGLAIATFGCMLWIYAGVCLFFRIKLEKSGQINSHPTDRDNQALVLTLVVGLVTFAVGTGIAYLFAPTNWTQ